MFVAGEETHGLSGDIALTITETGSRGKQNNGLIEKIGHATEGIGQTLSGGVVSALQATVWRMFAVGFAQEPDHPSVFPAQILMMPGTKGDEQKEAKGTKARDGEIDDPLMGSCLGFL